MKKIVEKSKRGEHLSRMPSKKSQQTTAFTGTKRVLATDDPAATPRQLRQPNERDESADEHLTPARRVMKQAHDDLKSGQLDTDARNRVAEVLPDVPKTPENFDESDPVDTAPRSKKKTSG